MVKKLRTEYNGYRFRSRLEVRWAVFFDACGIRWEYEPEVIFHSDCTRYIPSFYLLDFHCFFDVQRKGVKGTKDGERAIRNISYGQRNNEWAGIIAFGDPADDDLYIFCQESNDGSAGEYENPVTIGFHPVTHKLSLFAYSDRRDRCFYTALDADAEIVPMETYEYGKYEYDEFVNDRVLMARRTARFFEFDDSQKGVRWK